MEMRTTREGTDCAATREPFQYIMEPESSLPHPQELSTYHYLKLHTLNKPKM
jgi:hypothetical protein